MGMTSSRSQSHGDHGFVKSSPMPTRQQKSSLASPDALERQDLIVTTSSGEESDPDDTNYIWKGERKLQWKEPSKGTRYQVPGSPRNLALGRPRNINPNANDDHLDMFPKRKSKPSDSNNNYSPGKLYTRSSHPSAGPGDTSDRSNGSDQFAAHF